MASIGLAGEARQVALRLGEIRFGMAGLVGYGMVGSGTVCLGLAGEVRQCAFGIGWVMQVKVRFGVAGKAMYGWFVSGVSGKV